MLTLNIFYNNALTLNVDHLLSAGLAASFIQIICVPWSTPIKALELSGYPNPADEIRLKRPIWEVLDLFLRFGLDFDHYVL